MGVNKVMLLGRLGKDPELRYTQNQTPVTSFTLATSENRKGPDGNWTEQTEWHNIVCFGRTAENVSNYLKKGRETFIEGRIQTRKWQDKEGKDRWTTEVVANNVQFVGGHGDMPAGQAAPSRGSSRPAAKPAEGLVAANGGAISADEVTFDDDDIPF